MKPQTTVNLFGIPINAMTMEQSLDTIHNAISRREQLQIGVVNAAKIVNMQRNPSLHDDVLSSDLILADGASVVWASRIIGNPLPARVTGIDLMYGILRRGNHYGYRIYCFGATEEVSEKVESFIRTNFPNVVIAGRRNGYFSLEDEERIANDISQSKPDVLLVAISSPKKEKFLSKWSKKIQVPVCHGVGGSFDVMAGMVKRAPESWQRLNLEWLYRLKQEPRRLCRRYFGTNTLFCMMVIREMFRTSKRH